MGHEIEWKGERARALTVQRPCSCGCDVRGGKKGVGYLTGSDKDGNGLSIWIKSEKIFMLLHRLLKEK